MALTQALLKIALIGISVIIVRDQNRHQQLGRKSPIFGDRRSFDYIVIGGGTAGSVVAARLSENRNLRVLVLEEGGLAQVSNDIPAMDAMNTFEQNPDQLNAYLIQPQSKAAQGFPNHQFDILTGKVLGGTSTINGMFYNRGGPDDYNGWASDYGANGWSYEEVLPYFKKSENQTDPKLRLDTRYHGTGGPWTITSPNINDTTAPYHLLSDTFLEAAREHGYFPTDINGPHQLGTTRIQRNTRNGKRLSSAQAFLEPAASRPNLFILTGARVTRIHFNENKRAHTVQFRHNGLTHYASVDTQHGGEIILSAGTINSAKLLLLSGVGPQEDLERLGIPVVADLPVGKNLQDHCRTAGVDFVVNTTLFSFWEDLLTVQNLESLHLNGTGPLASQFYLHQGGAIIFKSHVPRNGATFGPSDLMIATALVPPGSVLLGLPPLNQDILDKYFGPYFGQPTLNLFSCLNHVESRGKLTLRSRDPYDPPLIDPAYLTHPNDIARLIEAFKFTMKLGETEAFQRIGATVYEFPLPGCEQYFDDNNSQSDQPDDYIECKIRHLSASEMHPAGTCKMGSANDVTAVVDTRLRVLGNIKGLRVADDSIMPSIVAGNLMAPAIMIGEKAAAIILEDRKRFT